MLDHGGLRYLVDQPRLNARQSRRLALISEFDIETNHINGKENNVAYALSRSLQVAPLIAMSTCKIDIKESVKEAFLYDENY